MIELYAYRFLEHLSMYDTDPYARLPHFLIWQWSMAAGYLC